MNIREFINKRIYDEKANIMRDGIVKAIDLEIDNIIAMSKIYKHLNGVNTGESIKNLLNLRSEIFNSETFAGKDIRSLQDWLVKLNVDYIIDEAIIK